MMLREVIEKFNASSLFLLRPLAGEERGALEEYNFINTYMRDVNKEEYGDGFLFALFKPVDFDFFELFLHGQQTENENFVEDYDYDGGYVVIVYSVPDRLRADYERFKKGEYSKFSMFTKSLFRKMKLKNAIQKIPGFEWQVFNKSEVLRKELEQYVGEQIDDDAELYPIPNEQKETLDIDKIRQKHEQLYTGLQESSSKSD